MLSWGNTLQCFLAPANLRDLYAGPNGAAQVTQLSAHTFGSWTLLSGLVRFYAAYHLANPQVYSLAIGAYVAILIHWMSEWLVFRTMKFDLGYILSAGVDLLGLVWMYYQWDWYVGHE